ncbi:hypothetical protein P9209_15465 [Prescottella defluvii]|nr:hypothetical protein P9209_15465 [Prescottella defluvii]
MNPACELVAGVRRSFVSLSGWSGAEREIDRRGGGGVRRGLRDQGRERHRQLRGGEVLGGLAVDLLRHVGRGHQLGVLLGSLSRAKLHHRPRLGPGVDDLGSGGRHRDGDLVGCCPDGIGARWGGVAAAAAPGDQHRKGERRRDERGSGVEEFRGQWHVNRLVGVGGMTGLSPE